MVSFIGNNIRPNGVGLIPPKKVIDGGYRTIIGNGAGLFSQPFTTEWTVAGDAAARTITLPLVQNRAEGALSYNCVVDWGDGTTPSLVTSYNDANRIHTYASDGTYRVKIYGIMEGWSFNSGGDCLKITKVIHFGNTSVFKGFKYLLGGFYGCSNLTSIGDSVIPASGDGIESQGFQETFRDCTALVSISSRLFNAHPNAESFYRTFRGCTLLEAIPSGLFDNNTANTSFSQIFSACTSIASIPSGLFDNNTAVTTFESAFNTNTSLTAIPSGLFDNNTLVTTFYGCFLGCSLITAIPSGLFDNNTLVTDFRYAFSNTNVVSIPSGLFDNNTAVTTFAYLFQYNESLETTPSELFRYNTACVDFTQVFRNCSAHQENIDLFYASGEESTRFLNQDVNFTSCFERGAFTGTQGTAPDLWNCSFGTGTPTTTDCWAGAGNDASSLTNYANIPAGWK